MRSSERGAALIIVTLATVSLMTVAGLAVMSTRTAARVQATALDHRRALHYAEAGVAAAMEQLRWSCDAATGFTAELGTALPPEVGEGNPLAGAYSVRFLNNAWDPSGTTTLDGDAQVVIESTGHGLTGAQALLLVHVRDPRCMAQHLASYGQKDLGPMGENRTDRRVDSSVQETQTFAP